MLLFAEETICKREFREKKDKSFKDILKIAINTCFKRIFFKIKFNIVKFKDKSCEKFQKS